MLERFVDRVKLLNPAERQRRDAKFLADRFDAIKPHLKELGVKVSNFGVRDFDNNFITTIKLSFDKKHEQEIKDELANAEINEIHEPGIQVSRWIGIGVMADSGFKYKTLKKMIDTRSITIFKGKNILQEDMQRLCTLEGSKKK